jgi:hypothetical protein
MKFKSKITWALVGFTTLLCSSIPIEKVSGELQIMRCDFENDDSLRFEYTYSPIKLSSVSNSKFYAERLVIKEKMQRKISK